jgi:hypothetical protein
MRRTYSDGMVIWMNGLDVYMHSMAFERCEDIWSLKTQTNKNHMYKPNFIQLPLSRSSASFQLRILSAQGPLLKKEASCFHSFCTHKGKKARDIKSGIAVLRRIPDQRQPFPPRPPSHPVHDIGKNDGPMMCCFISPTYEKAQEGTHPCHYLPLFCAVCSIPIPPVVSKPMQ